MSPDPLNVRDITAPVLILHSENQMPPPSSRPGALFVALRLLRHFDVEYWRFPGEGHEMSRSGSPQPPHPKSRDHPRLLPPASSTSRASMIGVRKASSFQSFGGAVPRPGTKPPGG